MMTPKAKASELYDFFFDGNIDFHDITYLHNKAKEYALKVVDEIIEEIEHPDYDATVYWREIREEIEKL